MGSVGFAPKAVSDISAIWDYTSERWGDDQADVYVRQILRAASDLASGRRKGRPAVSIQSEYLRFSVGAHVLFYRLSDSGDLRVVRVLHQRMDFESWL